MGGAVGSGGIPVSEGRVPGEAAGQEVAGGGKFLSDEPQPEEPSPHGVLGVVGLLGFGAGALEALGHLAEGQAKLDVAFQLSRLLCRCSFAVAQRQLSGL